VIIHIEEPDVRPLASQRDLEIEVVKSYYQDLIENQELKMKISKIIRELKIGNAKTIIEEFKGVVEIEQLYIKLFLSDEKLNASIMIPEIRSKEYLHRLLIYMEAMLEDLSLSLGLANGSITVMTLKINLN